MKLSLILCAMTLTVGCTHNVAPPVAPPPPPSLPTAEVSYPVLPAPPTKAPELPTLHVMVDNLGTQVVQCGETTVHVGKFDVNMPKGGTLEVAGVKGTTSAYHILLEDVTFSHKETCTR